MILTTAALSHFDKEVPGLHIDFVIQIVNEIYSMTHFQYCTSFLHVYT